MAGAKVSSVNCTTKASLCVIRESGNWLGCAGSPGAALWTASASAVASLAFGLIDSGLRGIHHPGEEGIINHNTDP